MSSLAQEESRSISENTIWGKRKAFADGKVSVAYGRFLGYDKGFVIDPEGAKTVQQIFKMFLSGLSSHVIARELTKRGVKSPSGKAKWYGSTVNSILQNEKYKGDALLQKGYTVDFLQKKRKRNQGEVPQYYVESHHEPIISPEIFEQVQAEIRRRTQGKSRYSGVSIFSSKIVCGECGGYFGAKVWHSTGPNRKTIYQCNEKYQRGGGGSKCSSPHLTVDEIKGLFLKALNKLAGVRTEVAENLRMLHAMATDSAELEAEKRALEQEAADCERKIRLLIDENACWAQDQEAYDEAYDSLYSRYEDIRKRLDEIGESIENKRAECSSIQSFIDRLSTMEGQQEVFDEYLWSSMVDHMTVWKDKKVTFTFVGGIEVTVK